MRKQPTKSQPAAPAERKSKSEGKRAGIAPNPATGKKVGRPTAYTQALAAEITDELANGRSLAQILSRPGMPSKQTVYSWLRTNREFLDYYVHAREEQADFFADQCVEIADATVGMDSAGVAAARVRIEARKWRASVMKPKVYGTKVVGEHLVKVSHETDAERIARDNANFDLLREKLKSFVVSTN